MFDELKEQVAVRLGSSRLSLKYSYLEETKAFVRGKIKAYENVLKDIDLLVEKTKNG